MNNGRRFAMFQVQPPEARLTSYSITPIEHYNSLSFDPTTITYSLMIYPMKSVSPQFLASIDITVPELVPLGQNLQSDVGRFQLLMQCPLLLRKLISSYRNEFSSTLLLVEAKTLAIGLC